jgi:hypothetical protein
MAIIIKRRGRRPWVAVVNGLMEVKRHSLSSVIKWCRDHGESYIING